MRSRASGLAVACAAAVGAACTGNTPSKTAALGRGSSGAALELATFTGTVDPAIGKFTFVTVPSTASAAWSELEPWYDGTPGSPDDTFEIRTLDAGTDPAGCGTNVPSYYGVIRLQSYFLDAQLDDVHAEIGTLSSLDYVGCGSATPPAGSDLSAARGLWSYGTIGRKGSESPADFKDATWSFRYTDGGRFTFTGRIMGKLSTPPTVDPGFPVCWIGGNVSTNSHTLTFSTSGPRHLAITAAYYALNDSNWSPDYTAGQGMTAAWSGGTPGGATAWTHATWPGYPGPPDGGIHWSADIFTASASDPITAGTVRVTAAGVVQYPSDAIFCVWSFSGASGFGARVDHHSPMADVASDVFVPVEVTITPTASSSLIIGGATGGELNFDYDIPTPFTTAANTTLVSQFASPTSGSGEFAFRVTAPTTAGKPVTAGLVALGSGPPYDGTQRCRAYAVEAIEVLAE